MNIHHAAETQLHESRLSLDALIDGTLLAFELTGLRAFIVDAALDLVRMSEGGKGPLPFFIRNGKLRASLPEDQDALEALVAGALRPRPHTPLPTPLTSQTGRKLVVRAGAIVNPSGRQTNSLVALWLRLPNIDGQIDGELISAMFALTPAEGRLAGELARGATLAVAAGNIGITLHTARDRLKSVFAKTHTRRQAELVGLITQNI